MARTVKCIPPVKRTIDDFTITEVAALRNALINSLSQPLMPAVAAAVGAQIAVMTLRMNQRAASL